MPTVSVLMVLHRDTPFLRPAIQSVLAQTWPDFEFLLVDNGSGLPAAALGEAGRDPRLRWIRLATNAGIPAGHNAGVAAARGEFVALIDYDDLARPHRLERQVAALRADPGLGLVSGLADRIDEAGRVTGRVFCVPDPAAHRPYSLYAAPVVGPAIMARREVLCACPYRAEFPFAADLDFQARACEIARFHVLPEVVLHYRWHPAQATQQHAASIEGSRAALVLCTARRRAGREEHVGAVTAALKPLGAAEGWRRVSVLATREGLAAPAAYAARRSFALDRSPAGAVRALAGLAAAWSRAPATERVHAARMFFTGPVRALGVQPDGKGSGAPACA